MESGGFRIAISTLIGGTRKHSTNCFRSLSHRVPCPGYAPSSTELLPVVYTPTDTQGMVDGPTTVDRSKEDAVSASITRLNAPPSH